MLPPLSPCAARFVCVCDVGFSPHHPCHGCGMYSVQLTYHIVGQYPRQVIPTYVFYVLPRQFRSARIGPSTQQTAINRLLNVLSVCTNPQVFWIHTQLVVTRVKYLQPRGYVTLIDTV